MRSLIAFLPIIVWLSVWVWALVDAGSRGEEQWQRVGESKTMWMLLIIVLQFFGTIAYLWMIRPKLISAHGS